MKPNNRLTSLTLLTAISVSALSPFALADASKNQKDKNNMRNLGIAGAAIAGYGLLNHNTTATVLGAAAGGYGAYKYEQDRKAQDHAKRAHEKYYYRGRSTMENGRKYYYYQGHRYYQDASGDRHIVD